MKSLPHFGWNTEKNVKVQYFECVVTCVALFADEVTPKSSLKINFAVVKRQDKNET